MRYSLPVFTLAAAAALLLSGCHGSTHEQTLPTARPLAVRTALPGATVAGGVSASGEIVAAQVATISTRVMGTIEKIYVRVGDRVRRGQPLVSLNGQDILARRAQASASIAEAQAALQSAQRDYDRFTALYARRSASAKELDNATLQYQAAQARLEAARQQHREADALAAYTRLTAPFDGVVTRKLTEEGSLAAPGMPLLTVEQDATLEVSATVSEDAIGRIRPGDPATLEMASLGRTLITTVTQVSPSSESTGGQYAIRLAIPSAQRAGLYAGMYVHVTLPGAAGSGKAAGTLLVPTASLVQTDQLTGLYTVSSQHTALLRWVRTGRQFGDQTEILAGLSANEPFIVQAEGRLYDGAPVTEPHP
ncbi:MAG TPA: efflux RND transporter periplasmic adaptor subunit [Chitinophagaceae bacterium]|nr:efflux RND transporter periplasmic adaptor subunit [Chitinophagaceae bacterium]